MGLQEKEKYMPTLSFQSQYFEKSHRDDKFQAQLDIFFFFFFC